MITKNLNINEYVELLIPTQLFGANSTIAIYEGFCERHYFPGKRAVSFRVKGSDGLDKRISTTARGLEYSLENGIKKVKIPLTQEYIISKEVPKKNEIYNLSEKIRNQAHV